MYKIEIGKNSVSLALPSYFLEISPRLDLTWRYNVATATIYLAL